jgi:hypothetical protein
MARLGVARGSAFESLVTQVFDAYEAQGLARVRKVDPPTRVVYRGNRPMVIQLTNPFLDFIGPWTERQGRMIMIEAKSSDKPRLPFDTTGDGISVEQLANMRSWAAHGAVTGALWQHAGSVRYVTLQMIDCHAREGRRSIPWAEAFPVPKGMGFVVFDILAVLRALHP